MDDVSDQSRMRSRRRRGLLTAYATGFIGRGLAVVAPLFIVPLLLQALGEENFGVWATVTSFTSMLVFADLGLGSGLLTALSSAHGQDDSRRRRQVVSDSYFAITAVAVSGACMAFATIALVNVPAWMGVTEVHQGDARRIIAVLTCGFFVTMPLSLITVVQLGVQQGWQSNVWTATGPVLSVPLVWVFAGQEAPPAVVVAGAVAGPVLAALANSLAFFLGTTLGRSLAPSLRLVSLTGCRGLLTLGSAFAGLSILSNVALNIDSTLIAIVLGSAQVTVYAIAARVFRSVALVVSIICMPLWGASGEALARGDIAWVRRTTTGTAVGLAAAAILITTPLVLFRDRIIGAWVGPSVDTSFSLYSGLALWCVLVAFSAPYFAVQNAGGLVRIQASGWGAFLILSISAKIAVLVMFGVNAIGWTTALCYALTVLPCAVYGYQKVLRSRLASSTVV